MKLLYAVPILLAKILILTIVKSDDWVKSGFTCASVENLKENYSNYVIKDNNTLSTLEIDGCCSAKLNDVCSFNGK